MRRLAALVAAASLLGTYSGVARAAGECPEGDWFCDQTPLPEPPPPAAEPPLPGEPPPPERARRGNGARGELDDWAEREDRERDRQVRIDVEAVRPARRRHRRYREWGVNLHFDAGLIGGHHSGNADMNGLGGALRFRPIPYIALEGSLELVWGTDYNQRSRFEDAVLFNALFIANPYSIVQVYGIAGLGVSAAFVDGTDRTYGYFGGQLGVGLETRVTRHFALNVDVIGFVRGRTDRFSDSHPEFTDPETGRTTNTSGGGLLRAGATFYW
jgi:hypothetical protein